VRTKGAGSVKSNAKELGSGVECKGDASQSDLGLMRGLMGVRPEATFTFSGVDWDAPFQRSFFKVIEGLLDRVGSFLRVREEDQMVRSSALSECLVP